MQEDSLSLGGLANKSDPTEDCCDRSQDLPPLVGRAEELDVLLFLLSATEDQSAFPVGAGDAVQTRPQTVVLLGDVGLGKTRLAEEVGREAQRRTWNVAWGRVYAQESHIPYRLWIEVLRSVLSPSRGAARRYPPKSLPLTYQPLAMLLPELRSAFPESGEYHPEELWEAIRQLLITVCEDGPLLLVLDDLHWSDGESCELLAYLARRVQGYPIVIVGTCRERDLPESHVLRTLLTDLQREGTLMTLQLEPLRNESIVALLSLTTSLPAAVIHSIQQLAAGNPFFAEELASGLNDGSAEDHSPVSHDAFLLSPAGDTPSRKIPRLPESIAAVFDLQLARLSSTCRRLLEKIACFGAPCERDVILAMDAALSQRGQPGDETALVVLQEAVASRLLVREQVGNSLVLRFWHPLLGWYLLDTLSETRRALYRQQAKQIRDQQRGLSRIQ